jgi:hypothetical protein
MKNKYIIITVFGLLAAIGGFSQQKVRWTNKDKGTYKIDFHGSGIFKDTVSTGIAVKFYELAKDSLRSLEGIIKINGKKFIVYDSTYFADADGFRDPTNYLHVELASGEYVFSASAGKNHYPITTGKYLLKPLSGYQIVFYFIRKDELKRN